MEEVIYLTINLGIETVGTIVVFSDPMAIIFPTLISQSDMKRRFPAQLNSRLGSPLELQTKIIFQSLNFNGLFMCRIVHRIISRFPDSRIEWPSN